MKNTKHLLVAMIAACSLLVGASSASAAINVSSPGAYSVTFPAGGLTFSWPGVFTASCATTLSGTVSATGAATVTSASLASNPCGGMAFNNFHLPWSANIVGSPGNYKLVIAGRVTTTAFGATCDESGNLSLPVASGSTSVGAPFGTFSPTSACPNLVFGGSGGSISPARTITGIA